ncbi:Uncharacterised protein [[Clostridium] sordellii]|uniref:hypothetical protein n=1 Tax=Paraclostridium sordellii TaxID=1505 RepID=UPI0005DBC8CF|nr:hypothetical protein [Paeniclostridium sordellii]CEQ01584.1 Uncharacterised protein [[Clostridium] sordellii] [Paeniclostridium sordellii]
MDKKVSVIKDFIQSKVSEIRGDIIKATRNYLDCNEDYYIKEVRNKMAALDYLETFLIDEYAIWDWAEEYYGKSIMKQKMMKKMNKEYICKQLWLIESELEDVYNTMTEHGFDLTANDVIDLIDKVNTRVGNIKRELNMKE